jgi:hypothetical protein
VVAAAYEIEWSHQYHATHPSSPTNRRFGEFVDTAEWNIIIQLLPQSLPTATNLNPLIHCVLYSRKFSVDTEGDDIYYTHLAVPEPLLRILISWFDAVQFTISSEKTMYSLLDAGNRVEGRVDIVLTAQMEVWSAPKVLPLYEAKRPGMLWKHEWDAAFGSDGEPAGNVERILSQVGKYLTPFLHDTIVVGDDTALVCVRTHLAQLAWTTPGIEEAQLHFTNQEGKFLPELAWVYLERMQELGIFCVEKV